MTEKLKTLKNLRESQILYRGEVVGYFIQENRLKHEAIKWYKLIADEDNIDKPPCNEFMHDFEPICESGVICGFIKKFFNLSEEDLK